MHGERLESDLALWNGAAHAPCPYERAATDNAPSRNHPSRHPQSAEHLVSVRNLSKGNAAAVKRRAALLSKG